MVANNKNQIQDAERISNATMLTDNGVSIPRVKTSSEHLVVANNREMEKELFARRTQSVHDVINHSLLRERSEESDATVTPPKTRREFLLGQVTSPYFQKIETSQPHETPLPELADKSSRVIYTDDVDVDLAQVVISSTVSHLVTGQTQPNTETEQHSAEDGSSLSASLPLRSNGTKRRMASSHSPDSPPNKKLKTVQLKTETRGRLASSGVESKPKDWTKATEKPSGLEKAEKDTCLTCINYGRNCHGTSLVQVEMKTSGKSDIRCITCASKAGHGGRRCYWKEPAKNINTYAQAKAEYHGIENQKNTRQGRLARARLNPSSRLSLVQNATYVPPDRERRMIMNYKPSRQDASGKEDFPAAGPAASPAVEARLSGADPNNMSESSAQAVSMDSDGDYYSEEIDEFDIKNAFDNVKAEVRALLRAHCGNQLSMRDLYTAMFVYVSSLDADRKVMDGINAKLRYLREEAVTEEF